LIGFQYCRFAAAGYVGFLLCSSGYAYCETLNFGYNKGTENMWFLNAIFVSKKVLNPDNLVSSGD